MELQRVQPVAEIPREVAPSQWKMRTRCKLNKQRRKNIPTDDEVAGAPSMLKNTVDVDPQRGQFPINLDLFSFDPGATTME